MASRDAEAARAAVARRAELEALRTRELKLESVVTARDEVTLQQFVGVVLNLAKLTETRSSSCDIFHTKN